MAACGVILTTRARPMVGNGGEIQASNCEGQRILKTSVMRLQKVRRPEFVVTVFSCEYTLTTLRSNGLARSLRKQGRDRRFACDDTGDLQWASLCYAAFDYVCCDPLTLGVECSCPFSYSVNHTCLEGSSGRLRNARASAAATLL